MRLVLVVLLGVCAVHDLKSRTIPAIWIWICLGCMLVYRLSILYGGRSSITELFLCILPGMVLFLLSYYSPCNAHFLLSYWGRQIGSGDGWLIIISGLCLGWEMLREVLTYAFLAAGLFGFGCLFLAHKGKGTRIPFVPFLLIGVLIPMVRDFL